MGNEQHTGAVAALRNLALSLERLAASEAASGAVRGAADGLRKELPALDGQLRTLVQDALTVLGRLAHEAAEHERVEPGAAAHTLAAAAMRGALKVLEEEWRDGGLPLRAFIRNLDHLFDVVVEFAHSRTREILEPGERARRMVQGLVQEASAQLHTALPTLAEDARVLAPLGTEVASRVGQGLVEGIESKLREDSDALMGLLERAGRSVVRGLAAGIRDELASSPVPPGEALSASLEKLAERSSAAAIRGMSGALEEDGRRWLDALRSGGALRRLSREITGGVMEALGAGLRRPLLFVAGAGGALVALSWRAVRGRGPWPRKG
ncbi:MAG: hypothetical protein ACJ8AT_16555 [Hyalangium sp.]|uniref:hypothetical protein n=1 Tax=Hyalangium sp. TaxID=2028555 RepID=UPI00389ADD08